MQNHIRNLLLADPGQEAGEQLDSLLADILRLETNTNNSAGILPDQRLIDQARVVLSTQPAERLIYDHLRRLPQFRGTLNTTELFGNEFDRLFTVDTEGGGAEIPRFYTRNLYARLDLSAMSPVLKQELISLNRIQKGEAQVSVIELAKISRRVREFYFRDYIRIWSDLIHSIRLQPGNSLEQIEQQTTMLAKGDTALQALLNRVASETSLAEEPSAPDVSAPDAIAMGRTASNIPAPAAVRKTTRILNQATRLLPASKSKVAADNPAIVNQAFAEYTGYAADLQSRLSPVLDQLLQELQAINGHFDPDLALYQLAETVMKNNQNILQEIWRQAASDDTRAGQWLNQLAGEVWSRAIAGAGRYCQRRWQQEVYPFWNQHLRHRFPMYQEPAVIVSPLTSLSSSNRRGYWIISVSF